MKSVDKSLNWGNLWVGGKFYQEQCNITLGDLLLTAALLLRWICLVGRHCVAMPNRWPCIVMQYYCASSCACTAVLQVNLTYPTVLDLLNWKYMESYNAYMFYIRFTSKHACTLETHTYVRSCCRINTLFTEYRETSLVWCRIVTRANTGNRLVIFPCTQYIYWTVFLGAHLIS